MTKIRQCYGIGQGLLDLMPPPVAFATAPNSGDTNWSTGQIVYTPGPTATNFYIYAGAGVWSLFATQSGDIVSVVGTPNQITVTTSSGVATISLPSAITTPGSLTTTTSLAATTTVTGGTGITATTGPITATNGNLVLGTAGNKLLITTGANASCGVSANMTGTPGAVTVATTACTASSIILFSRATTGGTPGQVSITAQSTSGFTLTSTGNETSTFNWLIIN